MRGGRLLELHICWSIGKITRCQGCTVTTLACKHGSSKAEIRWGGQHQH